MTLSVTFVLFPELTQLDLTAPAQVLSRLPDAAMHYASANEAPVPTDSGFSILPTATFEDAASCDIVCVPGGPGVAAALTDEATVAFINRASRNARYVTSVCTGAFLLGAAGALSGKRATTHWAYRHLLPSVGATPAEGRVVRDGNLFTGGGVTAGLDFALTVAAEMAGEDTARMIGTAIEYTPAPPFGPCGYDAQPQAIRSALDARYETSVVRMAGALDTLKTLR